MFTSGYEELDLAEYAQRHGLDPFANPHALLVRVLGGRFCFDVGIAAKCFSTTVSLTEGRTYGLELSLGAEVGGLKVSHAYKFERSLEYSIGDCDTISPAICYDDAHVLIHQVGTNVLGGIWKRDDVSFIPGRRPFIAGNKVLDDPECGCAAPSAASPPDDRISLELDRFLTRLLTTREFEPLAADGPPVDGKEVVQSALLALEAALRPKQDEQAERVGLVDLHGQVYWFVGYGGSGGTVSGLSPIVPVSFDSGATTRGRLQIPEEESRFPFLAFSPARFGASAALTLFVNENGRDVKFFEQDLDVRADVATAMWTEVDFSDFQHGTDGHILVELYNSHGVRTAEPLTEAFVVTTAPLVAGSELEVA